MNVSREPSTISCTLSQSSVSVHIVERTIFSALFPRERTISGINIARSEYSREHSVPSCRRYCCHHFGLVIKPAANVLARLSPLCHSAIFVAQTKKRTERTKTARGCVDRQTLISFCVCVREKKDCVQYISICYGVISHRKK